MSEDKLVNAIIDLHEELVKMRKDNNERLERLEKQMIQSNERLDKVERQLIMNNKGVSELRLSVMKLAERDSTIVDYGRRLRKLESIVLRNK